MNELLIAAGEPLDPSAKRILIGLVVAAIVIAFIYAVTHKDD